MINRLLLGSFLILLSLNVYAQEQVLTGTVYSEDGEALADAHVYLTDQQWAITDDNGQFSIFSVSPGTYLLTISCIGYKERKIDIDFGADDSAALEIYLREQVYRNNPVVITASRTKKELEDVSVPVTVVEKEEIARAGNMRLGDVLDEQIGLNIVSDHGTGIQVQGFDPEYTLILIDNQPVIGRSAGTLDLDRLTVGNIEQIEMVKGPSSALWGSEALAGVINIITDKGSEPITWDVSGRYGTHATYDAASSLTFRQDKFNGRFFTNFNGSDGYDLDKSSVAPTVANYQNYTFSGGFDYRVTNNVTLKLNGRYYREDLVYDTEGEVNSALEIISGDQFQEDYSITPEVSVNIGTRQLFELTGFANRYNSYTDEIVESTGNDFYYSSFDQTLNKAELKSSTFWTENHTSVFGTGVNREDLVSENYADVPGFTSFFAYGQHEWDVIDELSLTGGFRFDAHSEYSTQFSPKFSGLYKPSKLVHIRASIGGGFKAPTFNQLFLNFTNATVGYSVFGTSTVVEGMESLQGSGQIVEVYIPVENVTDIKAENSFSYNAGFDLFPTDELFLKVNFFRNNIKDMIDTQVIALKTNDQSVFSYFNLDKVYTQGIEAEARFTPELISGLSYSLGYQFLDARLQYEDTFDTVEDGVLTSVTETKYGELPGRSKHTGNFKIFYSLESLGIDASLRATYRSKFGIDFNGNERVDADEYVNEASTISEALEKTILNATVSRTFMDRCTLRFGVNNITNFVDSRYQPHYPGRTYFTQINIKLY